MRSSPANASVIWVPIDAIWISGAAKRPVKKMYITRSPNVIVPLILVVSLLGSFAIRNEMSDVFISLAFGALGYVMLKGGFTPIPLLLGLVLGEMVETNYHRALLISGGSYSIFYASVICKILILLTILSLVGPYLGPFWKTLTQGEK